MDGADEAAGSAADHAETKATGGGLGGGCVDWHCWSLIVNFSMVVPSDTFFVWLRLRSFGPLWRPQYYIVMQIRNQKTTLSEAAHAAVGGLVGAGGGEVVEGGGGGLNDVSSDEGGAFGGALFRALDTAFPYEDGPAGEIVLRELGKNCGEIDLAVAERAEAAGAIDPGLIATVDALPA